MSGPPEDFQSSYQEEAFGSGFLRFAKQKPDVVIGLTGFVGAGVYAYRRYKTRGYLVSPSLFLVQLRVGAQAIVVGCVTVAMVYNMVNQHLLKKKKEE